MTLLVFLGGSSLLEGAGIVSACPKVLNDFKADIFEVDPFIVITSIPLPTYQVCNGRPFLIIVLVCIF